jgi:Tfp pilus assembly protein PilO
MNWLPKNKQKRNQLFMALAITVLAVGGMYFGLIRPQYQELAGIRKSTADTQTHLQSIEAEIKREETATNQLSDVTDTLLSEEGDMATGDIYAWTVDTMRHFKANYKVDVPEIGQPSMGDVDMIPHFPYKQLRFSLRGTGYYHDIGRFIADLENKFPHMRVVNIEMNPVGGDSEKLSFSMDVIALVNSSS